MKKFWLASLLFLAGSLSAQVTGVVTPPAGADEEVQYNNNHRFGSNSNFTFNGTTLTVPAISLMGLGPVTGSGTSGQVSFWNGSSSLTGDPQFTTNGTYLNIPVVEVDSIIPAITDRILINGGAISIIGTTVGVTGDPVNILGEDFGSASGRHGGNINITSGHGDQNNGNNPGTLTITGGEAGKGGTGAAITITGGAGLSNGGTGGIGGSVNISAGSHGSGSHSGGGSVTISATNGSGGSSGSGGNVTINTGSGNADSTFTVNVEGSQQVQISTSAATFAHSVIVSTLTFSDGTKMTTAPSVGAVLAATQTWTGGNTFNSYSVFSGSVTVSSNAVVSGTLKVADGSLSIPGVSFSNAPTTGFYNSGHQIFLTQNGNTLFKGEDDGDIGFSVGSASIPSINFNADRFTGIFDTGVAAHETAIASNGNQVISFPAGVTFATVSGNESTGAGSAILGANSPASTLTAPYKWLKVKTSDGSTVYIPAWK